MTAVARLGRLVQACDGARLDAADRACLSHLAEVLTDATCTQLANVLTHVWASGMDAGALRHARQSDTTSGRVD